MTEAARPPRPTAARMEARPPTSARSSRQHRRQRTRTNGNEASDGGSIPTDGRAIESGCKVIPDTTDGIKNDTTDGSEDGAHLDEPRRDLHRWRTPHRHLHHQQHQPP